MMDANGQQFWMLAEDSHWPDREHLTYSSERRSLRLASDRPIDKLTKPAVSEIDAEKALKRVPRAQDKFGTWAQWDQEKKKVVAQGLGIGATEIYPLQNEPPLSGGAPTDMAMGFDDVLYLAIKGEIVLVDRRNRWSPVTVQNEEFIVWRLAADPSGGVWVLDKQNKQLGRVEGIPLREGPVREYTPETFRPCNENSTPPKLQILPNIEWAEHERPIAIACSPTGKLAILSWKTSGADSQIRILNKSGRLGSVFSLKGARHPYSLTWVNTSHIGVLLLGLTEAPVHEIPEKYDPDHSTLSSVGDMYPLRKHNGDPFVHGVTIPPYFPTETSITPLHRLSLPTLAQSGEARNWKQNDSDGACTKWFPLDSGTPQTAWHRLYLEANIPTNCTVVVWVAASDNSSPPFINESDEVRWHEHQFGQRRPRSENSEIPHGTWLAYPSEIPHHLGFLSCKSEPGKSGLFTVLIQRSQQVVRTVRGRYLWVRMGLFGDGRVTPEIAALRAYAPRFSYVNHYLPELYKETVFSPEADAVGRSTKADFLERFLGNFEGILTPLEDRIAHAHVLTDPHTAPDEALDWLGSWIGLSFDPAYPQARRRRLLVEAPHLFREHGTLQALNRALEIATDGGITGGEIVVIEDFRLRRSFATILGADLADESDPLLGGLAVSGNSYVGDTLFLGEEHKKEFLALFSADLEVDEAEADAIAALFDRMAYRVTILVHQDVEPQDLGLIRRIVALETPAHVQARVLTARSTFMVGIASLIGIDTYLSPKPQPEPVQIGRSHIGVKDFILRPPSLDPRLEGGQMT